MKKKFKTFAHIIATLGDIIAFKKLFKYVFYGALYVGVLSQQIYDVGPH